MAELLVALAVILSFLFGWNNSSFLIGNLRGSGSLSFAAAALISILGLLAGVLLEGPKMGASLAGALAPSATDTVLLSTMAAAIILTFVPTLLNLPVSISMVMVGAFFGATLSTSIPIDAGRAHLVVGVWFLAPLVTALLTFAVYTGTTRVVANYGLLTVDSLNRGGAVLSGLAVSYALGANNLGMITGASGVVGYQEATLFLLLAAAATAGMLTLGRGALGGTIGDRMLALSPQGVFSAFISSSLIVWAGTQLAVPVSISQCLLGGMLGAAYTRNITVVNTKLVRETVSLWVIAPLVAMALGYSLAVLI